MPSPMFAGSMVRTSPKLADVSEPPRRGVSPSWALGIGAGSSLEQPVEKSTARTSTRSRTRSGTGTGTGTGTSRSVFSGIERIAQALPEQVEAEHARHDGNAGGERDPR